MELLMPSIESLLLLLNEEEDADNYREEVNSAGYSSPTSLTSKQNNGFLSEDRAKYDVDDEDDEDAAFSAQAEAFLRTCDSHKLAVRRLLLDLVEERNAEAPTNENEPCVSSSSSSPSSSSYMEKDKLQNHSHQTEDNKILSNSARNNRDSDRSKKNRKLVMSPSPSPGSVIKTQKTVANKTEGAVVTRTCSFKLQSEKKTQNVPGKQVAFSNADKAEDKTLPQSKVTRRPPQDKDLDVDHFISSKRISSIKKASFIGPLLLKLTKQAVLSGKKPLELATRAVKACEIAADGKASLDLVMSLHILAAVQCSLHHYDEAIAILEHSVTLPDLKNGGQDHALASFSGYMQLGDTYSIMGRSEEALASYNSGLEIQMLALGNKDPLVGETCRYLAEAYAQALKFDKAELVCQHALDIHKQHSFPASIEEATDRRLMGLICSGKGDQDAALEHLMLARGILVTNARNADLAAVDASIGDTYVFLGRLDDAVDSYQKALKAYKAFDGEAQIFVASVYVSLAGVYLRIGRTREAKISCESALGIYRKQRALGHQLEEVASGLTEIATIYEALQDHEQALSFLDKAIAMLNRVPGQKSVVAGIEAQIGVLHYLHGDYSEAYAFFCKAVSKLRRNAGMNNSLLGIVLNQMGLACIQLSDVQGAVKLFEESKDILEVTLGPHHPDTLAVYSNLAGAYDALGRLDDAINVLKYTLEVREDVLESSDIEVEDERTRLLHLLKEVQHPRVRRCGKLKVGAPSSEPK